MDITTIDAQLESLYKKLGDTNSQTMDLKGIEDATIKINEINASMGKLLQSQKDLSQLGENELKYFSNMLRLVGELSSKFDILKKAQIANSNQSVKDTKSELILTEKKINATKEMAEVQKKLSSNMASLKTKEQTLDVKKMAMMEAQIQATKRLLKESITYADSSTKAGKKEINLLQARLALLGDYESKIKAGQKSWDVGATGKEQDKIFKSAQQSQKQLEKLSGKTGISKGAAAQATGQLGHELSAVMTKLVAEIGQKLLGGLAKLGIAGLLIGGIAAKLQQGEGMKRVGRLAGLQFTDGFKQQEGLKDIIGGEHGLAARLGMTEKKMRADQAEIVRSGVQADEIESYYKLTSALQLTKDEFTDLKLSYEYLGKEGADESILKIKNSVSLMGMAYTEAKESILGTWKATRQYGIEIDDVTKLQASFNKTITGAQNNMGLTNPKDFAAAMQGVMTGMSGISTANAMFLGQLSGSKVDRYEFASKFQSGGANMIMGENNIPIYAQGERDKAFSGEGRLDILSKGMNQLMSQMSGGAYEKNIKLQELFKSGIFGNMSQSSQKLLQQYAGGKQTLTEAETAQLQAAATGKDALDYAAAQVTLQEKMEGIEEATMIMVGDGIDAIVGGIITLINVIRDPKHTGALVKDYTHNVATKMKDNALNMATRVKGLGLDVGEAGSNAFKISLDAADPTGIKERVDKQKRELENLTKNAPAFEPSKVQVFNTLNVDQNGKLNNIDTAVRYNPIAPSAFHKQD